ncbi:MAG: hypothetical protein RLZZ52_1136 [Actinomycetota bacterium]
MHRPGEHREREYEIAAPEKLGEGIIAVPAGENIHIDLRLESLGDGILVSAEVETVAIGESGTFRVFCR